jgi:TolA-binding protein
MKLWDCSRSWELDAYREARLGARDAASFERHLRVCRQCARQKASDDRLRTLAKKLPEPPLDALPLLRVRRRILTQAATGRPFRRIVGPGAVAIALAAAVGGGWGLHRHASHPENAQRRAEATMLPPRAAPARLFAGDVRPWDGARWSQARDGDFEHVKLEEGTLDVQVRRQGTDERFVVALPDGVLEVRGTRFEVTVHEQHTVGVVVQDGIVELRLAGRPAARLGAGESWNAVAPTQTCPSAVAVSASNSSRTDMSPDPSFLSAPSSAPTARPTTPRNVVDDGSSAYAAAMQLLGSGKYQDAAAALHAFVVAHPEASVAEDASFLEAVALARAGRIDAAGLAAEHHLASFPGSFHRREAAVLVERAARLRSAEPPP